MVLHLMFESRKSDLASPLVPIFNREPRRPGFLQDGQHGSLIGTQAWPGRTGRDFLRVGDVFADDTIDAYIKLKMEEVTRFRMTTSPVEFDMYYSL